MPRLRSKPSTDPHVATLIGWREYVRMPALLPGAIIAKIDTGARSAALHAEDIRIAGYGPHRTVKFTVPVNARNYHCELPLAGERRVKSSFGHSEMRVVVATTVAIGEHRFRAEITLTNRTDMGVPMLLGRTVIRGRFIVHPGRSFLISKRTLRKTKLK
ncbi:RimK/LysX family protein [soil metagenome]